MKPAQKQNLKTVLFVDDESMWLEAIRLSLKGEKFKILTADGGEEALKKLERKIPDLIMSDVRMPFMNGFDLYEKVKSNPKFKNIPYVFMSSIDDFDAKRTAKDLGAEGYIEKPFDSEQIKTIVLDFLKRFPPKE
ncbi:MAG: two-component system response regulator [Chlorobiaceae bacterium]|nr:two-component system response regulator [Chlorobiaceae bacterium]